MYVTNMSKAEFVKLLLIWFVATRVTLPLAGDTLTSEYEGSCWARAALSRSRPPASRASGRCNNRPHTYDH